MQPRPPFARLPNRALRLASLLLALTSACAAEQQTDDDANAAGDSALVAPKNDDVRARRPAPPRSCDDLQLEARNLLGAYQQCSADADCVSTSVSAQCLAPFLCQVPVSRQSDLPSLTKSAAALSLTYRRTCGDACPVARCISPESLHTFCDVDTKRCKSEFRPSAPVPEADAGVDSDAGSAEPTPVVDAGAPSPFACKVSADCAVKNVGNCCGYYPRCANVAATFAPPKCDGRAGVCGFPTIESCECRANTCVALQGGREI